MYASEMDRESTRKGRAIYRVVFLDYFYFILFY